MRIRSIVRSLVFLGLMLGARRAAADIELSVVSTAPSRPHFVAAGAVTSFVVSARNTGLVAAPVSLRIQGATGNAAAWQARLFQADTLFRPVGTGSEQLAVTVPALRMVRVVAQLAAAEGLADDTEASALVSAWRQSMFKGSVEVRARIRNRPKIYYVAIDGCGRRYLDLKPSGTSYEGTGERLMPRAWSFASSAARLTDATSVLPAVTDPNHTAALTGSWAGTSGLYSVTYQYLGQDAEGDPVMVKGSRDLMRWGPDGERVRTVFDVAKDPASGGSQSSFNAFISGKTWLADLFRDDVMDLVADGKTYPDYVPAPHSYRLGDPISDPDADQDHEGTNAGAPDVRHLWTPGAQLFGALPGEFPDDRWIAEATVRIIQAEDPDVLYVDLANSDTAQHIFGAADRPEEWIDPGTPSQLWDDENVYNRNANRDPVLDVIHEADACFGLITDDLVARQALQRSLVVLLSDHGQVTARNGLLDPGKILLDEGFTNADVERMSTRGDLGFIAVADPSKTARMEAVLEAYELFDPVEGRMVKPFIVINREEMDSGVDNVEGPFAQDGIVGNRRGELYSEWSIDVPDTNNSKVRWPDLFLFMRSHFGSVLSPTGLSSSTGSGTPLNGVHGSRRSAEALLLMSGPAIQRGVYGGEASLADIAPTLYRLLGVDPPGNVNGRALEEILVPSAAAPPRPAHAGRDARMRRFLGARPVVHTAVPEDPLSFRVRIAEKSLAASVSRALEGASQRLYRDGCAAIFSDFKDASGQLLDASLARLGTSGSGYLALISFHEGKNERRCFRSRTFAFTFPGSRVVWVCPQFASEHRPDPGFGEVTLIHEALHSLGLGEDPPSAAEITSRVVARCGR